jgi:flagellin
MALTLNTNVDSIIAQNNLTGSQSLLTQSLTRLSSGLRINSAADDAAGLAISDQFTTQINGTNQAINNANDAVSEAQTTAGALTTITNNLQSIRTLAVEAANGSNSASDRQALDQQVQQQIAEITQIAQQTSFNGLDVLNGSSGNEVYQVGANVGDTISIDLAQGVGANQIGQTATDTGTLVGSSAAAAVATTGATGALTIQVGNTQAVSIGASSTYATAVAWQDGTSAYAKAAAINAAGVSGLTATATNTVTDTAFTSVTGVGNYNLSINGVAVFGGVAAGAGTTASAIAAQINQYSSQDGGVTASLSGGTLTLTAADGSNIDLAQTFTGTANGGLAITAAAGGTTYRGQVTLQAGANITVGGTSAADLAAVGLASGTTTLAAGSALSQQNVNTIAGANATIQSVDSALATVSAFQSQLGAIQNRFTAAVSNLTSTSQNLTQSRSTIEDANFAQETANLTQAQVLEQAGISVLAQANQEPQLILKLLS